MPHVNAADFRRFILHLVMPDAQLSRRCQLPDFLNDARVVNEPMVGGARLPNIDDLPDGALCLPAEVCDADRLRDIRLFVIINHARQFAAQFIDLLVS